MLLISADFLDSEYCNNVEVVRAIERHHRNEARVIPVILRPCDWRATRLGKLQAVPRDGRAITSWPNRDEAFLSVVEAVKTAVNSNSTTFGEEGYSAHRENWLSTYPRSVNNIAKGKFVRSVIAVFMLLFLSIVTTMTLAYIGGEVFSIHISTNFFSITLGGSFAIFIGVYSFLFLSVRVFLALMPIIILVLFVGNVVLDDFFAKAVNGTTQLKDSSQILGTAREEEKRAQQAVEQAQARLAEAARQKEEAAQQAIAQGRPQLADAARQKVEAARQAVEQAQARLTEAARQKEEAMQKVTTERVVREQAQHGELQVTLTWDGNADLDLSVSCPNGERIFFGNRAACGGHLDVDMNYEIESDRPVENIYWTNRAIEGKYKVQVSLASSRADQRDLIPFTVRVSKDGQSRFYDGQIANYAGSTVDVSTITVH